MKEISRAWRERRPNDKTEAEKHPLVVCKCGHPNTLHAGWVGDCGMILGDITHYPCPCQAFEEATAVMVEGEQSAFAKVKEEMTKAL